MNDNQPPHPQQANLETPQGRVPPQAIEVEEAILGTLLTDKFSVELVMDMLEPYHFYKTANRHTFEAIKSLHQEEKPIDVLTVESELKKQGAFEKVGRTYLADCTKSSYGSGNIEYYCEILIEKWIPRNIILGCNDLIKKGYDNGTDPFDLIDSLALFAKTVSERSFSEIPNDVSGFIQEMIESMMKVYEDQTGIIGVPAYLPIDDITAGFVPGDLYYVAARPSMGKTAYVLTVVINNILKGFKKPIILFSYEMSRASLLMRICCMLAKISLEDARRGQLDEKSWNKLFEALNFLGFKGKRENGELVVEEVHDSNLFIIDNNELDVDDVKRICRRILIDKTGNSEEEGLGIIITDYLQLMPVRKTREKNIYNREQEIAYSSRNLKTIAKELNVPVVALSQLSRAVEKRSGDNRPQLSDLRESGSTEQDADVVMFLYRPEYYKIKTTPEGQSTNGLCEVEIAKQRNGPIGMVKHFFEKEFALFSKWDIKDPDIPNQASIPDDNWNEEIDLDDETPF